MHAIRFQKDYAEQILAAIQAGEPLPVHPEGWTGHNMLAVAGVLYSAIFSQGPHKRQSLGLSAADLAKMHPEKREAIEETFRKNLHAAIDFASMLAFKVIDADYDKQCEPEVTAVVYETENGGKKLIPVSGFRAA